MKTKTLVTNIWGGPGVGKSTNASLLFGKLKNRAINAEYVQEYAKDLVWEGREGALSFQPYVLGKQMWRQHRLVGKVEVIVTESPLLLSIVYAGKFTTKTFIDYVLESFNRFNNLNIVLKRGRDIHGWNPKGRSQSEEEAIEIDKHVVEILQLCRVPYVEVPVQPGELTANEMVELVLKKMG